MTIMTKSSYPLKTRDQEIFPASHFDSEGMRTCSNTEKPSKRVKNGERATITTKGKTKTSSRNPWRTAAFEVPHMQPQRGAGDSCCRVCDTLLAPILSFTQLCCQQGKGA